MAGLLGCGGGLRCAALCPPPHATCAPFALAFFLQGGSGLRAPGGGGQRVAGAVRRVWALHGAQRPRQRHLLPHIRVGAQGAGLEVAARRGREAAVSAAVYTTLYVQLGMPHAGAHSSAGTCKVGKPRCNWLPPSFQSLPAIWKRGFLHHHLLAPDLWSVFLYCGEGAVCQHPRPTTCRQVAGPDARVQLQQAAVAPCPGLIPRMPLFRCLSNNPTSHRAKSRCPRAGAPHESSPGSSFCHFPIPFVEAIGNLFFLFTPSGWRPLVQGPIVRGPAP